MKPYNEKQKKKTDSGSRLNWTVEHKFVLSININIWFYLKTAPFSYSVSAGAVFHIPWRWNELTFRLFFLQNDSGVFWIHKGGKEVRTRSVYHDQERKNPADRWRVSWISMKNWELLFIWKGCPVMPEPLQKPVRLQMAEDICGIIQRTRTGI